MISSEPETEYPNLKQVLLLRQERIKEKEAELEENKLPDDDVQLSATPSDDLSAVLGSSNSAYPDQTKERKRRRDTGKTSDEDLHAKKPREFKLQAPLH